MRRLKVGPDCWEWNGSFDSDSHAIRCRQIMAHPQTMKILGENELTGKDQRLLIHLEDHKQSGKPLVVFASLVPEQERIARIARSMGLKVGLINGTVPAKGRAEIDRKFCAGEIQVLVGSPATAAVGYNWGFVDTIIFVSLDYKDSNFIQGYRRAVRGVRDKPLLIYILQYESKVEDRILEIVEIKSKLSNQVDETKEVLSLRIEKSAPPEIEIDGQIIRRPSMENFL